MYTKTNFYSEILNSESNHTQLFLMEIKILLKMVT